MIGSGYLPIVDSVVKRLKNLFNKKERILEPEEEIPNDTVFIPTFEEEIIAGSILYFPNQINTTDKLKDNKVYY